MPVMPKSFFRLLLRLLVSRAGDLVSRDDLVDTVWDGRIVSEATIAARISAARRAVGDDGKAQRIIRTVSRRGIQLACPVEIIGAAPPGDLAAAASQRIRFARSPDGTVLAYATTGRGPPLLRGGHWLTHLEQDWLSPVWRPLLDAFGQDFAVTRWDQRGTGLSARETLDFRIDAMADDLEAVADAAGLERFPIFAASQAVPVALTYAVRRPERVSRLVLYGGFATGRAVNEAPEAAAEAEAFQTLVRAGWGRPGSAFMQAFTTIYVPDATPKELESLIAMQLSSVSPETAALLRRATGRYDVRKLLSEVRAPTLVIHARMDSVAPLEQGQVLAAGINGAEMLVLESRNHIPLPQDPAWPEMVAATKAFLAAPQ
jgi:pimeloyl-ACP methyl ester carboxylesterase